MLPLYEIAIAPVLEAAAVRRVVEIGALAGETTVRLLDLLGDQAEVHVIDPAPQFDPSEHERRFPGRYHFHRDTSHNVLPTLPAVDAALIDGDHNWYTVYNELKMLAATAREAGAPLPLLFMHDVGWPYGRRDLYYAPERIPEEFRHAHARRGVAPGHVELRPGGGLNQQFNNAVREGGPRNGVMTALEDFAAEHDRQLRVVVLPIYFSLAIAAEEERLASEPRLAEALDRIEGAQGRHEQAELAESLRVRKVVEARAAAREADARVDRAARRYLEIVKGALLDEHYLENEVRLEYLHECARNGTRPDRLKLRDPRMWMSRELRRLQEERRTGVAVRSLAGRPIFPYTTIGRTGLDHLEGCLETIRAESIPGDLAACSVWRGGGAVFMRAFLEAHEVNEPVVWVADSFSGPPDSAGGADTKLDAKRFPNLVADLNLVRQGFARFGLLDQRVRFLQGSLADTLADAPIGELALLHLGDEHEQTTAEALERLYDRLVPGGFVVIEHYDAPGCRRAVDRFRASQGIEEPVGRVDWTGAGWRKPTDVRVTMNVPRAPSGQLDRAPIPAPVANGGVDLSVVVVFYNMQREAARTLHSLARSYQQGVEELDYEVIVVENGSSDYHKLGEDFVRGFGPQFRYLDLGPNSTPSPAHALNRGIAIARGESLALMIDGAHVLSPGVLRFGALGLRTYAPALVTTHQWYLGPGQQGEAMDSGYDQEYEDRLLDEIDWPADGYRLFEIGNFIGDRDWFDGLWESNCLFVPRALLEQVGGLDESFSMPGGGYANLDLFERLGATPGVTVVGIIGEASFHQVHGGTTTNQPDIGERHARLMSYRDHYQEVRKRPFRGPGKPRHFVGRMTAPALRTRPRWMTANAFRQAERLGANGLPDRPTPVPEQLRSEFTDAFWSSLAWRDVTWLGRPVERAPTDLVAYQELVARVRPDWIVDIREADGDGGGMFFASLCELVGSGRVLSVQTDSGGERPQHPRLTYVTGSPTQDATRREVFETVGEGANALVIIAPARARDVVTEFRAYAPLVGVGSYAILEGTILNGHPVLPGYGPGPTEAIQMILKNRNDFVPDHRPERFGLTFNPRGFLRRVDAGPG